MIIKILPLLGILAVLVISGCTTDEGITGEITGGGQSNIYCNPPYILAGDSCCLDQNNNSICDNNEVEQETPDQEACEPNFINAGYDYLQNKVLMEREESCKKACYDEYETFSYKLVEDTCSCDVNDCNPRTDIETEQNKYLNVGTKVVDYINNNIVQPGSYVTLVSVEEEAGLYKIITSYQGSEVPVYATKDGVLLLMGAYDLTEEYQSLQITKNEIITTTMNYLNNRIVQPGTQASLSSVEDVSGLYRITTSYEGMEIPIYTTKNGALLFIGSYKINEEPSPTQPATDCLNRDVIIQGATYDQFTNTLNLYVKNRGTTSLTFDTLIKYQNGTITLPKQSYIVDANQLRTFSFTGISNTIYEVTIQSQECTNVQDFIQRQWITGLT